MIREYSQEEVSGILRADGLFGNRVVHLEGVIVQREGKNEFECEGTAQFKEDPILENLLESIVPAIYVINAVENVYVIYHKDKKDLIPVLKEINCEALNPIRLGEGCNLVCRGKRLGRRIYAAEAEVYAEGLLAEKFSGEYVLVEGSKPLLRLRRIKNSSYFK